MKPLKQIVAEMNSQIAREKYSYTVPEHLLLSLVKCREFRQLFAEIDCGAIERELADFLRNSVPRNGKPFETPAYLEIIERNIGKTIDPAKDRDSLEFIGALLTFYTLEDSHGRYILEKHGLTKNLAMDIYETFGFFSDIPVPEQRSDTGNSFLINLTKLARDGKIDELIGRKVETERIIQTLNRRRKNNPVLVGEPGVGKTAIVEGLALKIVRNEVPKSLRNCEVLSLDMGALVAGTNYRGEFEKRLKDVIESLLKKPGAILFIDEIHSVVGAGTCENSTLDAGNILKPALARGELRCIGATTYEDYKKFTMKDRAFARRLQKIDVKEPSVEETEAIINGLLPEYEKHHGVVYDSNAVRTAVSLSHKYISDRFLPDKAIDIIDEAGARNRISDSARKPVIGVEDIEKVVSGMVNIPAKTVETDERLKLRDMAGNIRAMLYGQDEAVEKAVRAVKISRAGFGNGNRPVASFLFCGKSGVGKTELAKQLAEKLGINFIKFDMSEYSTRETVSKLIGTSPGYVGFEQAGMLTEALIKQPHSVVLLDEIEKADPNIYNLLLQVMDHGTLSDNTGRKADFRHSLIIMTSNIGAMESGKNGIGFNRNAETDTRDAVGHAVKKHFSPEFRNRLSGIIFFNDLDKPVVEKVVRKVIGLTNAALEEKNIRITVNDNAISWIAGKALEENLGARPVERIIVREIKEKMVDEILFGKLANGGVVNVGAADGELILEINGLKKERVKSIGRVS
ncbi:MAG: AAA family ATPase [Victivallales bacterium]|jgi:ATP-dependent Clp protease ATP-binding subunit ClpA